MSKARYALTFVAGAVIGIAALIALREHNVGPPIPPDQTIAFADKIVVDNGSSGLESIMFAGTLSPEAGYSKNNTVTGFCMKSEMRCDFALSEQIGPNQVGRMDVGEWAVKEWSPITVSAEQVDLCATTTMNINRAGKTVDFVSIPTNVASPMCSKATAKVVKWELGRSMFWVRNDPKNELKN